MIVFVEFSPCSKFHLENVLKLIILPQLFNLEQFLFRQLRYALLKI